MENEHIYCCSVFWQKTKNAGEKDIAFIPKRQANDLYFVMQFRNLDSDATEGILSIIQSAIKFCPFCGTKLSNIIDANRELIGKVADNYKDFVLDI